MNAICGNFATFKAQHSDTPKLQTAETAKGIFDNVYLGVCGSLKVLLLDARYVLTFIGQHTYRVTLYLMERSPMVPVISWNMRNMLSINQVLKDGHYHHSGGDCHSKSISAHFVHRGIFHELAVLYIFHQNEKADRLN